MRLLDKKIKEMARKEAKLEKILLSMLSIRNNFKKSIDVDLMWEYDNHNGDYYKKLVIIVNPKDKKWWEFWK